MLGFLLRLIVVIVVIVSLYGAYKPLPAGVDMKGSLHTVRDSDVSLLTDMSYIDEGAANQRHSDQEIFDTVFDMINNAQEYVLVDFFFYSDFLGTATSSYRQLAGELTDTLIARKQTKPDMAIQVITDPINIMYNGYESPDFERIKAVGIPVIVTDLRPLRDTNPLYSGIWRTFLRWIPDDLPGRIFPNPLDTSKPRVPIQAYFNSFNFKANHRKLIIADYIRDGQPGMSTLVTSANPHDGSSAHTNTALKIDTHIWRDALESERATAAFSQTTLIMPSDDLATRIKNTEDAKLGDAQDEAKTKVQLLTERSVERKMLELIDSLESGDSLDMAMFYISDRHIIRALKRADKRGVAMRFLLDANKDAFGREKNGIPNRQVAHELLTDAKNTQVRWCLTHGEQCHSKITVFRHGDTHSLIQGSANMTSRNLDNLTLETDVYIEGNASTTAIADARRFFEKSWGNEDRIYSTEYDAYKDTSFFKMVWYRIGEFTGLSRY